MGGTVTFGYDVAGQRTSLTDPNNATRNWSYDDGGRMMSATDAEGRTTSYGYDDVSRRTEMTDARGVTITTSFDDAGQMTAQVSPNETRSYTYDNVGRRTAWSDASGSTTVSYDDVGRMTGITNPAGTVTYGYNAAGEQTSMVQPEGTVTTGYDVNGFVDSVTDWRGDTFTMTNDADGRMLTAARSNGVDTNYSYDDAGRLTGVGHTGPNGGIGGFSYMLDPNGNRTAVMSNAGTETYTLDALNRLTNVTYPGALSETFAYDAAGNRTSHTKTDGTTVGYTVDATGQLISDTSGTTYSYDAAGNLTGTSDGESYTYDDYGRHTSISAGGVTQTYGYDATNTRVTVDGQTQLWDRSGGLPTLISTSGGDNYVHTEGIARDGDGWLLADAVGSVRTIVDNTGTATGSQSFTAFGEQLTGSGTFGFAGEQHDPTGLQHLRARQYNPALGRFTTVDPVQPGAPGTTGYNLYAYSGNNPTTWTDPSGRFAEGVATYQPSKIAAPALVATGISLKVKLTLGAFALGASYGIADCVLAIYGVEGGPGCSAVGGDNGSFRQDEGERVTRTVTEDDDEPHVEVELPEPDLQCSDVYSNAERERLSNVALEDAFRIRGGTLGATYSIRNRPTPYGQAVAVHVRCDPQTLLTSWFTAARFPLSAEQRIHAGRLGILDVDNGDPNTEAERKVLSGANQAHEPLAIAVTLNICGPEREDCRGFLRNEQNARLLPNDQGSKRAIWPTWH